MRQRALVIIVVALALVACGGPRVRGVGDGPVTEYSFEPVVIHATVSDTGEISTVAANLPELFAEGNDYLRADDFANAARIYTLVLETFDDDEYRRVTLYNLGLSYEGLERWRDAALVYAEVVATWPGSDDATFALFRLAECRATLGDYYAVPPLMRSALSRIGLALVDRVEARIRWGNALLEQRDFSGADEQYRLAIDENRSASLRWVPERGSESDRPLDSASALVAQLHFSRGRVFHELFSEIRFVLPEQRLTADLVDKTQLFEQAQESYLEAVRSGHQYWAPAAGFMVGRLFEDYYFDVLATEIPEDFGELELEVYFEELRAFVEPAMTRAMGVYEHNLALAYRLGSHNVWVDDTLASIERVYDYLENRSGWEAEQQLIIERRHPRSAHYADHMEFRTEPRRQ